MVLNLSLIPENQADMERLVGFAQEQKINIRVNPYMFPPVRREREEGDSRFTPAEAASLFWRSRRLTTPPEELERFRRETATIPERAAAEGHFLPHAATDAEGRMDGTDSATQAAAAEPDWGAPDADLDETTMHMACRAGKCTYWVAWDGSMTACGMTSFPRKVYPFRDGFAESWQQLRASVQSAAVMAGCNGCGLRQVCHPCVAMLSAETGDVNRRAPYLCSMAEHICRQAGEAMERT